MVVQGGGLAVEAGQLLALHVFLLFGEHLGLERLLDSLGKQLPA